MVAGAWIALIVAAAGCQGKQEAPTPASAPKVVEVEIPSGTKVTAVLLKQLESGIDDEGTEFPMLVAEDVKDPQGHVLIRQGTPMQGRVTWSRREGTLSGLMNQPARLKFAFESTVASDGTGLDLCADPKQPDEAYELNRGNTGLLSNRKQIEEIASDEKNGQALAAMQDLFENGDSAKLETEESRQRLAMIAQKLNLPGIAQVAQQNEMGKVKRLLDQLRQGASLSKLAPAATQGPVGLTAIMEMADVCRSVNDRMNHATHGRNIKAYVGTPLTAYTKSAVKVKVSG